MLGTHVLHDLGSHRVFGIGQRVAQRHFCTRGGDRIGWCPDLAAGQFNGHGFIHFFGVWRGAVLQCCAIDKGLEGRARLAPRLLHMVKGILRKIAAADPGQYLRSARIHGDKAGLYARLVFAQILHERLVGQQRFECVFFALFFLAQSGVGHAFAHQLLHQRIVIAPGAGLIPAAIGHALQRAALACHGLVGPGLQARINGGMHHQTIGVDVVVVLVCPFD